MANQRELSDLSFSNILTGKRVRSSGEATSKRSKKTESDDGPEEPFTAWKRNVSLLYDTLVYHSVNWASVSCAFAKNNSPVEEYCRKRNIFFSTRTDTTYDFEANKWKKGHSSRLFLGTVELPEPNMSNRKYIGRFSDSNKSSRVTAVKKIIHPGDVRRIRVSHKLDNILATTSDSCGHVFVWDVDRQPDRTIRPAAQLNNADRVEVDEQHDSPSHIASSTHTETVHQNAPSISTSSATAGKQNNLKESNASIPDLILSDHDAQSETVLSFSPTSSHLLTASQSNKLLLWNLMDAESGTTGVEEVGLKATMDQATRLTPSVIFEGHGESVTACAFNPFGEGNICISTSDDSSLMMWDSRAGSKAVHRVGSIHGEEAIKSCSWNPHDANLIATGGLDRRLCVLDARKFGDEKASSPLHPCVLQHVLAHDTAVNNIVWSPHSAKFVATSSNDTTVRIWKMDDPSSEAPQLFFNHGGHKLAVKDFEWDQHDPWLFLSVSDDGPATGGTMNGTVQLWRVTELLSRAQEPDYVSMLETIVGKQ